MRLRKSPPRPWHPDLQIPPVSPSWIGAWVRDGEIMARMFSSRSLSYPLECREYTGNTSSDFLDLRLSCQKNIPILLIATEGAYRAIGTAHGRRVRVVRL